MSESKIRIGIAVGSPRDKICSIGSFARAEFEALNQKGESAFLMEPDTRGFYLQGSVNRLDALNVHIPSLFDRKRPWNVLRTALKLRQFSYHFPIIVTLHELSEAPLHWRLRAKWFCQIGNASGLIVNSDADYQLAKQWGIALEKMSLGPTLWNDTLLKNPTRDLIQSERENAISRLKAPLGSNGLNLEKPWLLHAGLITPGKGITFLQDWSRRILAENANLQDWQFVLAGGFGPKRRDVDFAQNCISEFRNTLGKQFVFLESPSDKQYQDLLIAADLVALPYDFGVSERRSSFLSACASGAHIWTTTSHLSVPLKLQESGVQSIEFNLPQQEQHQSLTNALVKDSDDFRLNNLIWANRRTWPYRIEKFLAFVQQLISNGSHCR